jgi:ORF6N domain
MQSSTQPEPVENRIVYLRGQAVMLSRDLAELYNVTARELNQQVKRNPRRFPPDFVFQLTGEEAEQIRAQVLGPQGSWRGKLPYAFTEQGAGMLAAVLRSPTAAKVSVEILRAFARLRAPKEPSESTPLGRRASMLFAAIRDGVLLCKGDKAFTTEVPSTYFLQAGKDGPIKIGSTRNLAVRIRTLMTMSPVPLQLLGVMKGDHEESCHMQLGIYRIHGEWFTPAEPVLEFIRANAITPRSSRI